MTRNIFSPNVVLHPSGQRLSGLNGLNWTQSNFCGDYDLALDLMVRVSARATEERLNTSDARDLAARAARETGWNLPARTWSNLNCAGVTTELMQLVTAVNKQLKSPIAIGQQLLDSTNPNDADERKAMSPFAKAAIIGGITVAGIIGIAVITGQVAPLLRAFKR